jgi:hypothetical protein
MKAKMSDGRGSLTRRFSARWRSRHRRSVLERDFPSNRHPALSFCLSMISAQTLRVCREGKPVTTLGSSPRACFSGSCTCSCGTGYFCRSDSEGPNRKFARLLRSSTGMGSILNTHIRYTTLVVTTSTAVCIASSKSAVMNPATCRTKA